MVLSGLVRFYVVGLRGAWFCVVTFGKDKVMINPRSERYNVTCDNPVCKMEDCKMEDFKLIR